MHNSNACHKKLLTKKLNKIFKYYIQRLNTIYLIASVQVGKRGII